MPAIGDYSHARSLRALAGTPGLRAAEAEIDDSGRCDEQGSGSRYLRRGTSIDFTDRAPPKLLMPTAFSPVR